MGCQLTACGYDGVEFNWMSWRGASHCMLFIEILNTAVNSTDVHTESRNIWIYARSSLIGLQKELSFFQKLKGTRNYFNLLLWRCFSFLPCGLNLCLGIWLGLSSSAKGIHHHCHHILVDTQDSDQVGMLEECVIVYQFPIKQNKIKYNTKTSKNILK